MSVYSEIGRIKGNIRSAYSEVAAKSGTIPSVKNSENLAEAIDTILTAGSDPIELETKSVLKPTAHPVAVPELVSPSATSQVRTQEQPIIEAVEICSATVTIVEVT